MKKKGFTLIELIAVLVIMAIIALIVTPLVMSIIRKARVSADKRSIDAYGRSIELAVASYLLDTGKFPTDVSQLTIEYSGSEVVCETTQLNSDSSVYLTGCTVGGRSVDYAYGKDKTPPAPTYEAYTVSATAEDTVTYNGEDYYVIENSGTTESTVKLLKAEPLSYSEVNTYSAGTGAITFEANGYGGMQYHASSSAYNGSYVKTTVEAWAQAKAPAALEARLITIDEVASLGYEWYDNGSAALWQKTENTPIWLYNSNYGYWIMSPYNDSASSVWLVNYDGGLSSSAVSVTGSYVVRPVITLSKSAL